MPNYAFAQKSRSITAKNEKNMVLSPAMDRIFFEVHCSKFKPGPIRYLSQASEKKSISHRVLFLCICKHPFNCLFSQCVYCFVFRSTPNILCHFDILTPYMPCYCFLTLCIFGTLIFCRALLAFVAFAFKLLVAVTVCR